MSLVSWSGGKENAQMVCEVTMSLAEVLASKTVNLNKELIKLLPREIWKNVVVLQYKPQDYKR